MGLSMMIPWDSIAGVGVVAYDLNRELGSMTIAFSSLLSP